MEVSWLNCAIWAIIVMYLIMPSVREILMKIHNNIGCQSLLRCLQVICSQTLLSLQEQTFLQTQVYQVWSL